MKHVVTFDLTEDENMGGYGLLQDIVNDNNSEGLFQVNWTTRMLFHDLFEHYFEGRGKFSFRNMFNIQGEMYAMGHFSYYQEYYQVFNNKSIHTDCDTAVHTTWYELLESFQDNCQSFPSNIISIPYQRPIESCFLSEVEFIYLKNLKDFTTKQKLKYNITDRNVIDLHRLGYKKAKSILPYSSDNYWMVKEFLEYWDKFFKNDAEQLYYYINKIDFVVDGPPLKRKWKATFHLKDINETITIKSNKLYSLTEEDFLIKYIQDE